jgi:hypothetical protein
MSSAKLSGDGPASGNTGASVRGVRIAALDGSVANPLFAPYRWISEAAASREKSRRVHEILLNFRAKGVTVIVSLMGGSTQVEIQPKVEDRA